MSISLKELKKNRLTPAEKWLLERIEGIEPITDEDEDGSVRWFKGGEFLFEQNFKIGYLGVSYYGIWFFLFEKFALTYGETNDLLANLLYDYTDNGKLKIKF